MYQQKYQSRVSRVDGQAFFLGETPNGRPIGLLRSAARHRNADLPLKLPAHVSAALQDGEEMTALRTRLAALSPEESDERKKIKDMQMQLKKEALIEYQKKWLQEDYHQTVSTASVECKKRSSAGAGFGDLRSFFPEHVCVANMIEVSMAFLDERRKSALEGLIVICGQESQQIWYRPGEKPVDGRCPVSTCGKEISK